MRIKSFAGFCLTLWCFSIAIAHAEEPGPAFEKLVRTAFQSMATANFVSNSSNKWYKVRFALLDLKYDVKKTDSLLNPIIGIVSFKLFSQGAGVFDSKEDAERATFPTEKIDLSKGFYRETTLTYVFKDEKWSFKDGEYQTIVDEESRRLGLKFAKESLTEAVILDKQKAYAFWLPSSISK